MQASASSEHTGATEGPASLAIDDNPATWWHTHYGSTGDGVLPQSLTIELDKEYVIDRYSYLSRGAGGNGGVKGYELQVSMDGDTWYPAATGELKDSSNTQEITFAPVNARYVRLVVNSSYGNQPNMFASAAEINIYRSTDSAAVANKDALQTAVNAAEEIVEEYCESGYDVLATALEAANAALEDENVPQTAVDIYTEALNNAIEAIVYKAADKTDLTAAVSTYGDVNLEIVAVGADEYTEALEAANALLENEELDIRDQADIDEAVTALQTAYNALAYKPADLSVLSEALENYGNVNSEQLTPDTKTAYDTALQNVQALLNAENLDIRNQAEINAAAKALEDAYNKIEYKEANITALQERYEAALKVDLNSLTEESRQVLEAAMKEAKTLLDSADELDIRDQQAIEAALNELSVALANLDEKPTEEKPSDNKPSGTDSTADGDKAVQTGDTASFGWIILLMAAGAVTAAVCVNGRKSRRR